MNLNYTTRQSNSGSESPTMIFRFKAKHLLVLVSLFFLSVGPGCSQQRYKPAKWRAAQRDADAKDQGSSAGTKSGAGTSAWSSGREMGTMPVRGGGTLPRRGWDTGTLPNRGAGSTMPARQFERGSTLPQRDGKCQIAGARLCRSGDGNQNLVRARCPAAGTKKSSTVCQLKWLKLSNQNWSNKN